jgi:hypothetical protein
MMTSGYDLGSLPECLRGWGNGQGWHSRDNVEHVVLGATFVQAAFHSGVDFPELLGEESPRVASARTRLRMVHQTSTNRPCSRLGGEGDLLFLQGAGVMPQSQEVKVAVRAQQDPIASLNHCRVCPVTSSGAEQGIS